MNTHLIADLAAPLKLLDEVLSCARTCVESTIDTGAEPHPFVFRDRVINCACDLIRELEQVDDSDPVINALREFLSEHADWANAATVTVGPRGFGLAERLIQTFDDTSTLFELTMLVIADSVSDDDKIDFCELIREAAAAADNGNKLLARASKHKHEDCDCAARGYLNHGCGKS